MKATIKPMINRDILRRPWFDFLSLPVAFLIPLTALAVPLFLASYLVILAIFALIDIGCRKAVPPKSTPLFVALAVLVGWSAFSILWSIAPADSVEKLLKLIVLGAAATGVIHGMGHLSSAQRLSIQRLFFLGWLLAVVLFALDVALDARLYIAIFNRTGDYVLNFVYLKRGATVMMLTGWLISAGLFARKFRFAAMFCLAATMLLAVGIAAMSVIVAWVAGVMSMAVVIGLPRVGRQALPITLALLIVASPFLVAGLPGDLTKIATKVPTSALHRLAIWQFSADRVAERPVLGWGLDSARAIPGGDEPVPLADWLRPHLQNNPELSGLIQQFEATPPRKLPLHPHNAALQWWLELGAVGAVLGAAILLLAGRWLMAHANDRVQAGFAAGLYTASVTCTMLMFGIWQGWWLAALAFVAVGARLVWPTAATTLPVSSPTRARVGE